jgi:hypothetical protein
MVGKRLKASFARGELLARSLLMEGLGDEKRRSMAKDLVEKEVALPLLCASARLARRSSRRREWTWR